MSPNPLEPWKNDLSHLRMRGSVRAEITRQSRGSHKSRSADPHLITEVAVRGSVSSKSPTVRPGGCPWAQGRLRRCHTVKCPSCGERGKIAPALDRRPDQVQAMRRQLSGLAPAAKATAGLTLPLSRRRRRSARGNRGRGARCLGLVPVDRGRRRPQGRSDRRAGQSGRPSTGLRPGRHIVGGPPRVQGPHPQGQVLRRQIRPEPAGGGPQPFRPAGLDRQVDVDAARQGVHRERSKRRSSSCSSVSGLAIDRGRAIVFSSGDD